MRLPTRVAMLRERSWPGDAELADAIDDDRHAAAPADLVELPVDLEELAMLLDAGDAYAAGGRVDLRTGEVWPASTLEEAWPGPGEDLDDEDRWLGVWPQGSRAGYADMLDFAATRSEPLVERLERVLHGRSVFRRFKDVLFDWPEDREQWFAFSEDRQRGRARAWLADAGYRAAVPRLDHSGKPG